MLIKVIYKIESLRVTEIIKLALNIPKIKKQKSK